MHVHDMRDEPSNKAFPGFILLLLLQVGSAQFKLM
jgi:hypothetical protein